MGGRDAVAENRGCEARVPGSGRVGRGPSGRGRAEQGRRCEPDRTGPSPRSAAYIKGRRAPAGDPVRAVPFALAGTGDCDCRRPACQSGERVGGAGRRGACEVDRYRRRLEGPARRSGPGELWAGASWDCCSPRRLPGGRRMGASLSGFVYMSSLSSLNSLEAEPSLSSGGRCCPMMEANGVRGANGRREAVPRALSKLGCAGGWAGGAAILDGRGLAWGGGNH